MMGKMWICPLTIVASEDCSIYNNQIQRVAIGCRFQERLLGHFHVYYCLYPSVYSDCYIQATLLEKL